MFTGHRREDANPIACYPPNLVNWPPKSIPFPCRIRIRMLETAPEPEIRWPSMRANLSDATLTLFFFSKTWRLGFELREMILFVLVIGILRVRAGLRIL